MNMDTTEKPTAEKIDKYAEVKRLVANGWTIADACSAQKLSPASFYRKKKEEKNGETPKKRGPGRPKGAKNKPKAEAKPKAEDVRFRAGRAEPMLAGISADPVMRERDQYADKAAKLEQENNELRDLVSRLESALARVLVDQVLADR